MQHLLCDLFHAPKCHAMALLLRERMISVLHEEVRTAAHRLSVHGHLKINRVPEEEDLVIEPARKGRLIFASRRRPELVASEKGLWAHLSPDTPDEELLQPNNRHRNSASEIEGTTVYDALVRCKHHSLIEVVSRDPGYCFGCLCAVTQRQRLVMFSAYTA